MASVSSVADVAVAVAPFMPIAAEMDGVPAAVFGGSDEGGGAAPDVEEGSLGSLVSAVDGGDGYEDVGSDPLAAVVEGGDDPPAGVVEGVRDLLAEGVAASAFNWEALGLGDAADAVLPTLAVPGATVVRVPGQEGPAAFRLPAPLSLDALVRIGRSGLERAIGGGVADEGDLTARVLIAEAQGDGPVGALTPRPSAPIIERLGIKISGGTVTVAVQDIERSSWRTQRADIDLLVQGLDAAAAEVDAARGLVQVRLLESALRSRLFGLSTLAKAVAVQAQTAQARAGGATATLPGDMSVEDALILLTAAGIASDKIVRFIHSDARIAMAALRQIQSEIAGAVTSLSVVDGADLSLNRLDLARITAVLRASQPSSRVPATAIRADEAVPLIVLYGMLGASGRDSFPLSPNLARAVDVFVARYARVPHTAIARIVVEQLHQLVVDLRAVPPQVLRRAEPASLSQSDPLRVDAGAAAHGDAEGGDGQADSGASPE